MAQIYSAVTSTGRYHATIETTSSVPVKTLCGVNAWTESGYGNEQVTAYLVSGSYVRNSQLVECVRCENKAEKLVR
jgi:hypothetical protein